MICVYIYIMYCTDVLYDTYIYTCCKAQKLELNIENVGGSSHEQNIEDTKAIEKVFIVTTNGKPHSSSIQTQLTGYALVLHYKLGGVWLTFCKVQAIHSTTLSCTESS